MFCSVCQEEICQEAVRLPCEHTFHGQCIANWLVKQPSCPVCRWKHASDGEEEEEEEIEESTNTSVEDNNLLQQQSLKRWMKNVTRRKHHKNGKTSKFLKNIDEKKKLVKALKQETKILARTREEIQLKDKQWRKLQKKRLFAQVKKCSERYVTRVQHHDEEIKMHLAPIRKKERQNTQKIQRLEDKVENDFLTVMALEKEWPL